MRNTVPVSHRVLMCTLHFEIKLPKPTDKSECDITSIFEDNVTDEDYLLSDEETLVITAWDGFMQQRPSGLRIKRPTCFPALVAIVQVPIIGSRRRRLTVREAARLQSFDDKFIPNPNKHEAYKQFGNAVNVKVIQTCAERLFTHE